jgi:hypothetical protein
LSSAYTPDANAFTNERSHLRSWITSTVQFPVRKLPFFVPRGAPGLKPPCKRHRWRPRIAGRWHAAPERVSAPQRGACLRFLRRLSVSWSMGLPANFCCPPARPPTLQGSVPISREGRTSGQQDTLKGRVRVCPSFVSPDNSLMSELVLPVRRPIRDRSKRQ